MFGVFTGDCVGENLRHVCGQVGGTRQENYRGAERGSRDLYGPSGKQPGEGGDSWLYQRGEERGEKGVGGGVCGWRWIFYPTDNYCERATEGARCAGRNIRAGIGVD